MAKEAVVKNWRLAVIALILLVIAGLITAFPSLQAEAQSSGCRQKTAYTCIIRGRRRVCGYLTYWVCQPKYASPRPYWYR